MKKGIELEGKKVECPTCQKEYEVRFMGAHECVYCEENRQLSREGKY
jgi:hypothetical protein